MSVPRGVALLVAGALFMEILDATIITPAIPLIASSLGVEAVDEHRDLRLSGDRRGPHTGERVDGRPVRNPQGVHRGNRGVHSRLRRLRGRACRCRCSSRCASYRESAAR